MMGKQIPTISMKRSSIASLEPDIKPIQLMGLGVIPMKYMQ